MEIIEILPKRFKLDVKEEFAICKAKKNDPCNGINDQTFFQSNIIFDRYIVKLKTKEVYNINKNNKT